MATVEKKLRVTVYLEPVILRVLALPSSGESVIGALTCLTDQVMKRTQRLAGLLTAHDWEFFQRATEAILYDKPLAEESWRGLLWRAMKEAATYQSLHTEVWGSDPAQQWRHLQNIAKFWDDLDAYAILCACRWYHNQSGPDVLEDGWWDVALRVRQVGELAGNPGRPRKKRPGRTGVEKP